METKENLITEDLIEKKEGTKRERKWILFLTTVVLTALITFVGTTIWHNKKQIEIGELIRTLKSENQSYKVKFQAYEQRINEFIEESKTRKLLDEDASTKQQKNYKLLVSWVYKNSSKISKETAEEVVKCSLKTNFPLMHLAIMKTESNFDPTSISSKGASGIGQQMPKDYEKPLIEAGILTEWRDIFNVSQGVKATEFAWNHKFKLAKGQVLEALKFYYGDNDKKYIEQILIDYHYLIYLCNFNGLDNGEEKTADKENNIR